MRFTSTQLENESDEDKGRRVLVIFDYDMMLNQTSIASNLPPYDYYEDDNNIEEMPWLDITLADCNCSHYPRTSSIAVRNGSGFPATETQSDSSDSCDGNTSEHDLSETEGEPANAADEEVTQFTEYFKVKGSTYHDHFQKALRQCKRLLLNKQEIPVQLVIEPANLADENAIIVQAELENMWHPVGYIPGVKVKKAMDALDKEEIKTTKFKAVEWKYIYALGEFRYVCSIAVTKLNKWLPSNKDYQYNDILQ